MGVDSRHYVIVGWDLGYDSDKVRELQQIPELMQFIEDYDEDDSWLNVYHASKYLEDNYGITIVDDSYGSRYYFVGALLMKSDSSRWGTGGFDGMKEISMEDIEEAKRKLLASPVGGLMQTSPSLIAGTNYT